MTISHKLLTALAAAVLTGAALATEPPAAGAGIERLPPGAELPTPGAAGTPPAEAPAATAPRGDLADGEAADAEAQAAAAAVEEKRRKDEEEIEAGERQASPAMSAPAEAAGDGGRI